MFQFNRSSIVAPALIGLLGLLVWPAVTTAQVDVSIGEPGSVTSFRFETTQDGPPGQYYWDVAAMPGVNHVTRQWFWFRTGSTGPEKVFDQNPAGGVLHFTTIINDFNDVDVMYNIETDGSPTDGDGSDDLLVVMNFQIDAPLLPFTGVADLAESIAITNFTPTVQTFSLFHYVDFQLDGTPGNDIAQIFPVPIGPVFAQQTTTNTGSNSFTTMTVAVSNPSLLLSTGWQAGDASAILSELNDAGPDTFSPGVSGPYTGDAAWVTRWTVQLGPFMSGSDTVIFSIDKPLGVPEPATLALMALGGSLVVLRRRSRRARD